MTNETNYRIWWKDGSRGELFSHTKINEMADRFDFSAVELRDSGDIEMLDEGGDVVGGVVKE